jgi:hypothetical protein
MNGIKLIGTSSKPLQQKINRSDDFVMAVVCILTNHDPRLAPEDESEAGLNDK